MNLRVNLITVSAIALFGSACATQSKTAHSAEPAVRVQSAMTLPKICAQSAMACITGEHSLIVGPAGQVAPYAGLIEDAEKLYAKTFKAPPTNSVLFLASNVSQQDRQGLKDAGYEVVLPWVSGLARQAMVRRAIRAQVTAQNSKASEAEIEAIIESSLERAGLHMNVDTERGAISHELAHMWFMKNSWPRTEEEENNLINDDQEQEPQRYGSGAPDWLDEMAAVLSENDFLINQRRETAKEIVEKGNLDAFWPLKTYFTMEHPIFRQTVAMLKARGDLRNGTNVVVLTGAEARGLDSKDGRQSPHFYAQSRVFADFMIETSKEPYIFDAIARALGTGMNMDTWLSKNGENYDLKTNIPDLQKQWEAWLVKS